jgi:hypothetical protein
MLKFSPNFTSEFYFTLQQKKKRNPALHIEESVHKQFSEENKKEAFFSIDNDVTRDSHLELLSEIHHRFPGKLYGLDNKPELWRQCGGNVESCRSVYGEYKIQLQ